MSSAPIEYDSDTRYGQALVLFGIASLLMLTLGAVAQTLSIRIGLVITLLFCVLTPAVIFVRKKGISVREGLRLRPVSPSVLVASVAVGAGGWSTAAWLAQGLVKLGFPSSPVSFELETSLDFVITLLVAAALPGFCEECLFRGSIQGVLERRGKWIGVVFAGVLFGIFHMDPVRMVAASYIGIIAGALVVRTGSLWPAILSHFANNTVAISVAYFLPGATELPGWLLLSLVALFSLALVALMMLTRSPGFQASVQPSPLASVPAGLSKGVAWGCGIPGALFGGLVIAGVALLTSLVLMEKVTDDGAAPSIRNGDQVMLIKRDSFAFSAGAGKHVALKRNGNVIAREVARVDGNTVWILEDGNEIEIPLQDIVGAVAQVIPGRADRD